MPCIEPPTRPWWSALALAAATLLIAGCAWRPVAPTSPPSPPPSPSRTAPPSPAPQPPATRPPPPVAMAPGRLPAPPAARNWDEFKLQAARRLVAANAERTYMGPVPEPLLAIPVLEVELNADGSVRRVDVLRQPSQARDTTQLAIDAVHRAAPYGDMTRLPRPWKWAEAFLFNDDRRFKPRVLDQ